MHSMHRGHSFAEIYRLTPTRELTEDEEKPACPPTSQEPLRTIGPDALQIPKVAVAVEHRDQHLVLRMTKMVRTDPLLYQVSMTRARQPGFCLPPRGAPAHLCTATEPFLGRSQSTMDRT